MRNPLSKKDRARCIHAGIWLMIFVLLAYAVSNVASTAAGILPKAREYKISSTSKEGFTVGKALKSEEALEQAGITVYSSRRGKLAGENGVELSVTQKVTDDRYADVYGLPLLRGTYFVSRGIESMDRFAVISDKAALALFKSLDAVGHEVNMNQTRYTVVGVYEHNRSLLNDLSSDGNDMVFVPLSSQASVMEEMPVNLTVPLQGNDGSQDTIGAVQEILGGKLAGYQTQDLTQAMRVMEQNVQILWFIVGITSGILLLRIGLRFLIRFTKNIRERKQKTEPSPFRTKEQVYRLAVGTGLLLFTGVIWSLVSFSPYIPPQYLPEDNIFDLGHYWQQFLNLIHTRNAGVTGYDFYGNIAFYGIVIHGVLLPVAVFAFFACIRSIRKAAVRFLRKDTQKK